MVDRSALARTRSRQIESTSPPSCRSNSLILTLYSQVSSPASLAAGEIELSGNSVVLLNLRIFARRDDSAREPSKSGGKANARELTAES